MKIVGRINPHKQAVPFITSDVKVLGKIKPHRKAKYDGPLSHKPFSNLRNLIEAKKLSK